MKTKISYFLVAVLCFIVATATVQAQKPNYKKKLHEALLDVDAKGNPKDSLKVIKYSKLLAQQMLEEGIFTFLNDSLPIVPDEDLITNIGIDVTPDSLKTDVKVNEVTMLDCELNIQKAIEYLDAENDSIAAIKYLQPCVEKGNDEAQLLMGRLYAAKKTEENYLKAFDLFKKSAQKGNDDAMADLGVLYKYGRGCKLSYNKARRWFKKAAKFGNDKATYSLGYLYLKGFGSINQNYAKAVQWFKKSNHPMANYWLGVCYKNGYGLEKNNNEANKLLDTDFAVSKTVKAKANDISQVFKNQLEEVVTAQNIEITEDILVGKWKGQMLQLDWSESNITNKIDFSLEILKNKESGTINAIITIGNTVVKDEVIKMNNTIYFNNTECVLPHASYAKDIPSSLLYKLLSSNLSIKNLNNTSYLIGNVESYIDAWKEAGVPLKFVVKKETGFKNSNEKLSDDVLKALSKQKENFIKLYPNPFENDLVIAYELAKPAIVKVQINTINGNLIAVIQSQNKQEEGKHRYFYDASKLRRGVYTVSVFVNNERKTRITIKK